MFDYPQLCGIIINYIILFVLLGVSMAENTRKINNSDKNCSSKKKIVAAVCVAVLAAVIALLLVFKNALFYSAAEAQAENCNFESALSLAEYSEDGKATALRDYLSLRIEINKYYPFLVSDFNIDKIKEWHQISQKICTGNTLDGAVAEDARSLDECLSQIVTCYSEYMLIKSDTLEMMDVFNEINRLHTKDAEGKNTSFTVAQEREKIARWKNSNQALLDFVSSIPGVENIYLINFLAKEAQGEIAELSSAIDTVALAYGETALVRFGGDAVKRFPDIYNSNGDAVNLLDKNGYEKFMFEELCKELARNLGGFYTAA